MAGLFGFKAPQTEAYAQKLLPQIDFGNPGQAPQKPGFFGEGGVGRAIAGIIGDTLLQQNHFAPVYAPAMQQRQAMNFAMQKAAADRQAEMQDWQAKQEYEAAHPKPINNDTVNDVNWYINATPEQKAAYDQMHPIVIDGPDGRYAVPRSSLMGATAPIGGGVSRSDWDKAKPVGGPTQNASGTFPAFANAVIGQESGGRYGIPNTQGSGAMGVGQLMPDTAKAIATRLGMPYRPDLLAGNHPEAQSYQNALTNSALQEAWNYGGGDPRKAAYYYFAGPNQKGWGPKTRQYGENILRRMGGR